MMAVSLRIQPCLSTGLVPPLGHHTDSASTPHQQMTRQDARACLVSGLRLLRTVDGWPAQQGSPLAGGCVLDPTTSSSSDFMLAAWNIAWWAPLHHGNWQTLRIKVFLFPPPSWLVRYPCWWPLEQISMGYVELPCCCSSVRCINPE